MTPAQRVLYFREWGLARKARPDADRHALHVEALGMDKSSKRFTNRDLDRVLAVFRAISRPDDVDAQLRQQAMERTRALYTIGKHPAEYVQAICMDRFGTADLEQLDDAQAAQLAMTLANRRRASDKRAAVPSGIKDVSGQAPVTEDASVTVDCPF